MEEKVLVLLEKRLDSELVYHSDCLVDRVLLMPLLLKDPQDDFAFGLFAELICCSAPWGPLCNRV